jgi:two-component system KDP operon response regulator KdpE
VRDHGGGVVTRLLLVDDEPHLLRTLVLNSTARGYDVSTASTGTSALGQIRKLPPDVLVLDLGLPDVDGLDVIRELHGREPDLPIIVLSARSSSHDKVLALDLGAIDYVTKPFDMNEIFARIRTVIRRAEIDAGDRRVQIGDVDVDLAARTAQRLDTDERIDVHLTPTEWRILDVLTRRPGSLVTSRELLTAVRGDPDHSESSYLRIFLAQLRRKLEPTPSRPRHLITESGMGYRFIP